MEAAPPVLPTAGTLRTANISQQGAGLCATIWVQQKRLTALGSPQVEELRINVFEVQGQPLEHLQQAVKLLAAVPRLCIHSVSSFANEERFLNIMDALAPIAGSLQCCDLEEYYE
jgi:hypothetical protein